MAQVYKMMLGTSGRQWEQLTVSEDGTMMLYFHGTDRSVTQRVTLVEDGAWKGWLRSEGGSLYPGIESGRWQAVDCPAESAEIAESEQRTDTDGTDVATAEPITINPAPLIVNQAKPARPRRQRKARKAVSATTSRRNEGISGYRDYDTAASSVGAEQKGDNGWLRSVGYLAAASVALLVIWQTGLIIPLGLLGLATSGFLK